MTANGSSFSAVLLAAGEGSRLGRVAKSLLRLDGRALIEHQVQALLKAGAGKIIIVTGYYYSEIEVELEKIISNLPAQSRPLEHETAIIKIVRNPEPEQGQQSSVRLGLETLAALLSTSLSTDSADQDTHHADPILIALVDQPLMSSSDYQSCLAAFHQRPSACSIVYPVVEGQRGNPVVFSKESMLNILQSGLTCRDYIDQHRTLVHRFETSNDHFVVDIDQEQDRLRFEQRTGRSLSLPRTDSKQV